MVRPTILDRYIAGEVVKPLGLGLAVFTFALVTGRMLKLTEMVVNHGVALGGVLRLLGLIMPAFFELTLPMAVLLGVLLGFGRLSGDRELIAARACGVSLYRLAVPVVAIGCIAW
ncbi:MAG: LptF/LptG family permease, partial [Deltaproteobacteria bacterium]|nr:LptF/LptG family permease [Deltaproteobacteria bacterium]